MITEKKTKLVIFGLALLSFLSFFNYSLAQTSSSASQPYGSSGVDIPSDGYQGLSAPSGGIKDILTNVLEWLLSIIGIIAIISFVISGFQYFLAAGDEKSMDTAKRNLTYSIIGIIVALSGYIVVQAIDTALQASSSSF